MTDYGRLHGYPSSLGDVTDNEISFPYDNTGAKMAGYDCISPMYGTQPFQGMDTLTNPEPRSFRAFQKPCSSNSQRDGGDESEGIDC